MAKIWTTTIMAVFVVWAFPLANSEIYADSDIWTTAWVNITYKDPHTGRFVSEKDESGRYGSGPIRNAKGWVVHTKPRLGCSPLQNDFTKIGQPWIALISRGNCTFSDKFVQAMAFNASAVVVYNNVENEEVHLTMAYQGDLTGIMISSEDGRYIASLIDNDTKVFMDITLGTRTIQRVAVSKTSVLFVSISFIVLMVISLAWLVFYYIQRFRYAHARDKSQKRLGRAAKKAISKLHQRTLKENDAEIRSDAECCAVCIEPYKLGDVIRIVPCKHYFHKACVDQWLVEHRTCPMCKLNILKALGHDTQDSQDSLAIEVEVGTTGSNNGNETEEESLENYDQTMTAEPDIAEPTTSGNSLDDTCHSDDVNIQNLVLVWVPEESSNEKDCSTSAHNQVDVED